MAKYLRKFETSAAYTAAESTLVKPNVSYIVETNGVAFNPIPPRMDIITYEASAKLAETTSYSSGGLHTNAFNTTIKSHTFENGVGTIEFNGDVTSIGERAFLECTGLTSITIPSGVTSIGDSAFDDCTGLTSIVVDSANTVFDSRDNCNAIIKTSTNELVLGYKNTIIPNSVTSIGNYAFSWCSGLTSVTIPDSVTSIGIGAFSWCSDLQNVTIGSGVTSIDECAFQNCSGLTNITCNATTAPTIYSSTFDGVGTGGTLTVPSGSTGYDVWMGTGDYYLGKYNWTMVKQ